MRESHSARVSASSTRCSPAARVNVVLPSVHPRMGTPWSDAQETPLLETPGFMLTNYGRYTAALTVAAHVAYGAIVGWFAAGLALVP